MAYAFFRHTQWNIAVNKHIECAMKLTDGSLAKFEPLLRATWWHWRWPDERPPLINLPPVRHVGHFKLQKMLWPMKTATVCHHSDSYCLYILKWKSSYFLKKNTFLWLHLGLHHGSIIRIIQVGSYSISSSSAWKSQKKRSETSRSTDYLSKKLWLYPIRPYVVCCCML